MLNLTQIDFTALTFEVALLLVPMRLARAVDPIIEGFIVSNQRNRFCRFPFFFELIKNGTLKAPVNVQLFDRFLFAFPHSLNKKAEVAKINPLLVTLIHETAIREEAGSMLFDTLPLSLVAEKFLPWHHELCLIQVPFVQNTLKLNFKFRVVLRLLQHSFSDVVDAV